MLFSSWRKIDFYYAHNSTTDWQENQIKPVEFDVLETVHSTENKEGQKHKNQPCDHPFQNAIFAIFEANQNPQDYRRKLYAVIYANYDFFIQIRPSDCKGKNEDKKKRKEQW